MHSVSASDKDQSSTTSSRDNNNTRHPNYTPSKNNFSQIFDSVVVKMKNETHRAMLNFTDLIKYRHL